jgi:hypothetical protein
MLISDTQKRALELRAKGLGYQRIGQELGVSKTTARRLARPGYLDHSRYLSRTAKTRRKQPCIRGCGNLTSYDNRTGVCQECRQRGTA